MTVTTHNNLELCGYLSERLNQIISVAEAAASVETSSPTSSKNAHWAHIVVKNSPAPAWLILHIRTWSPEVVIAAAKAQLQLVENFSNPLWAKANPDVETFLRDLAEVFEMSEQHAKAV